MRIESSAPSDGVAEYTFTLAGPSGDVPGIVWTPERTDGVRPLVLLGHGGGQHKSAPGVVARAHRLAAAGLASMAIDAPAHGERPRSEEHSRLVGELRERMQAGGDPGLVLAEFHRVLAEQSVAEWRAALDEVQALDQVGAGPVGYWGVSLGCALGVPLVAAEPRIRAAVLGLNGEDTNAGGAERVTVPVHFLMQWDDELVPRAAALALFDRLGSADKTLHANPGRHNAPLPDAEIDSCLAFLRRHLV